MFQRRGETRSGLTALILSAALALFPAAKAAAQGTLCAEVRLEIKQEATLEREAFDALLEVTNQYPAYGLENFRVNVIIKDPAGNPADGMFFVKISSKEAVNAIDGTGIIQPASTATIHWLIIPGTGAGGTNLLGRAYSVRADISYKLNGVYYNITTIEDTITVKPQPALKLEYILPFEVFSDEPLTDIIEPIEPFPLGVRITNVGYGSARNFQINSGQPEIIESSQSLAIDFKLLGTYVGNNKIPDTLLIPFGDIAAGGVTQAAWIMSTSLSGRFTQFTATFTHSAELGGALTSLIQNVTTYTLIKDVLVDLPGRDSQFDFLVNTTTPRGSMEALLDAGTPVEPDVILESDQPEPIQVARLTSALIGDLSGTNIYATLKLTEVSGSNLWVFTSMQAPLGGRAKLVSALRPDGTTISKNNIWISRHFRKSDRTYSYRLNLLDYNPPPLAEYILNFSRESLDAAPGPITDLSAFSVPLGGQAGINWRATGEDAGSGAIMGGRYLIQAATSPAAAFAPALALINIATNTTPGVLQTYLIKNLPGNASYYFKVWLQDTGGNISADSNPAETYVLPNPPTGLIISSATSSAVSVAWSVGNNYLPIEYGIWADTDTVAPPVLAAPFKDSLDRSYTFAGLTPNTTYLFYGIARNTETLVTSEQVLLGHALTLAAPPGQIVASQLFASSFTFSWDVNANNGWTEYFVQISTMADCSLVAGESGWVAQAGYTFSALTSGTTYYARAKARNSGGVETAFANLGVMHTKPVDIMPPVTGISFSTPTFAAGLVYVSSLTAISLSAYDDVAVAGDRLGVAAIYYAVDSDTFSVYAGTFSVTGEGAHVVKYYSTDASGNIEAIKTSSVAVDETPPAPLLEIAGPLYRVNGVAYVSGLSTVTFKASDAASGVKELYYEVNGSTYSVLADSQVFTLAEGTYTLSYSATDNLGNASGLLLSSVTVDNAAPVTMFDVIGSSLVINEKLYVLSGSSVTLAASDAASGEKEIYYNLDGSTGVAVSPLTLLPGAGAHVLEYNAADNVGNTENLRTLAFLVDSTAPVTTALIEGVAGSNGWHVSPVMVTLASTDTLSGVRETFYSLDSSTVVVYVSSFPVTAEGAHVLASYSTDNVGNSESAGISSFKIDVSTPVVGYSVTPSYSAAGWNNSPVDVLFTGTDAVSGIAYCSSSFTVSAEGLNIPVSGYCTDYAGLSSTAAFTVNIDTTQPVIASTRTPANVYGWNNGAVTVGFECLDGLSGMNSCPAGITYSAEGVNISTAVRAFDIAGNSAELVVDGINIDTAPPLSTAALSGIYNEGVYSSIVSIVLSSTDTLSGVKEAYYSLDGGTYTVYGQTVLVTSEGSHTLRHYAADKAGNTEVEGTVAFVIQQPSIDSLPPVTGIEFSTPSFGTEPRYISGLTAITLSAYDDAAVAGDRIGGIAAIYYAVDSDTFTVYAGAFGVAGEGAHVARYYSVDASSNTEAIKTSGFIADNTTPVTTASLNGVSGANGWHVSPVTVTLASTDTLSGVRETLYNLDGSTVIVYGSSFPVTAEGTHVLAAYSIDKIGNTESVKTFNFKIDLSSPGIVAVSTPIPNVYGWNNSAVTVKFACSDNLSGMAGCPGDIILASDGVALSTAARAYDLAGNAGEAVVTGINIDRIAPETAVRVNGVAVAAGVPVSITSTDTVALSAMDPAVNGSSSGVMGVFYTIDAPLNMPGIQYAGPFTLPQGQHMVYYAAKDMAGNIETIKSAAFTVTSQNQGGPATISGTISTPGLPAGSNITVLASTDYFRSNMLQFTMPAQGGSVNYSITVPAPGMYSIAAMGGSGSGSLIGIYNNYMRVDAAQGATVQNINFSIAPDGEAPGSAIISIMEGATITGLQAIGGMASDNIGVNLIEAAVQDMATQLWWNGQNRQWMPSDTGPIFGDAKSVMQGPPNNLNWNLQAAVNDGALAGLTANLIGGRIYRIAIRARDFSGNTQQQFMPMPFTWNAGGQPQDTVAPITTARARGQEIPNGSSMTITTGDNISLDAIDPVVNGSSSGVMGVYYTIDMPFAMPAPVYTGPFTLPQGQHMVNYAAKDMAGNIETTKSAAFTVTSQNPGGPATISGTISTPGLPDGSNITVLASTDYFRNHMMQFTLPVQGGNVNYSITVPAPGMYSIAAMGGSGAGSLIGIYNNYVRVNAAQGATVQNINFSIAPDGEAPGSAITSIMEGATIPGLQAIGGMASDNIGVNLIEAAVQDMATQLWWNGLARQWLSSDTGPIFGDAKSVMQGTPNNLNWNLQAAANDGALAGLTANLISGRIYRIAIRARDFSGNTQQQFMPMAFTWNAGGQPQDTMPPVTTARALGQEIPNGGSITITTGDNISLGATDPLVNGSSSGVMGVYYTIDMPFAMPAPVYTGPFTLPQGQHVVNYAAKDMAGNLETTKSAAFTVTSQNTGGPATISGTISTPGLPDGSNITVLASTDYFRSNMMQFTMPAQGGNVNYSITVPAPGMYSIAAMGGSGQNSLIGFFNNYTQINAPPGGTISDINFAIAPDNEPPASTIATIADGATIPGLPAIGGMAADNAGVNLIEAAVQDIAAGLWWNGQSRQWMPSDTGPVFGDAQAIMQGPPNNLTWNLQADTNYGALAGLASQLINGKVYRIFIRARDFNGNTQQQPVMVGFTWNGRQGPGPGGQATISGTISTPGLPDGSNITVLASTDYFRSNMMQFTMPAQSGSLGYSITVPAPGMYSLAAMGGSGQNSLIGIFNNYLQINAVTSGTVSNVNFSMASDVQPPNSGITSISEGAIIPGLPAISGLAADNVGVTSIEAAVQAMPTQLWWNAQNQQWVQSNTGPVFGDARVVMQGPPNNLNWALPADPNDGALAGLTANLVSGQVYKIYIRARDFSGNTQPQPAMAGFSWLAGQGPGPVVAYYVDGAGGNDINDGLSAQTAAKTITRAVTLAPAGSIITVVAGVYHESVGVNKPLTLSASGQAVLDGDTNGDGMRDMQTGFMINSSGVRINGFTVRNYATGVQAMQSADLVISSCVFTNNANTGVQLHGVSNALIEWNIIGLNQSGLFVAGENIRLRNNTVYSNTGIGISLNAQSGFEAVNNIVVNNQWGVVVNTVQGRLDYNDVWGNRDGDYALNMGNQMVRQESLHGAHDISADPAFTDKAGGDVRLQDGSPCLGTGEGGANIGYYQERGVILPSVPLVVRHLRDIGGWGTESGRFSAPTDVAVARWGSAIYVTDSMNFRVQKLTVDGKFISSFGRFGSGPGEFGGPIQTAVGLTTGPASGEVTQEDLVYVADPGNYRVQLFLAGKYIQSFGTRGAGPGQFEAVTWVAATPRSNLVFVSDEVLNRVQVFDTFGVYQYTLGAGLLNRPRAIAVSSLNNSQSGTTLYVVDSANGRIAVFNGTTLTASWIGDFSGAAGIHVGNTERAYISDARGWVSVYSTAGRFLGKFGSAGPDALEFQQPGGIATDPAGYLYIADSLNDRVQKVQVLSDDTAAPGPVNPSAAYVSPWYAMLDFQAAGDDGLTGAAAWYDVRFTSYAPINTPADFETALPSYIPYQPKGSGSAESIMASGLQPGYNYNLAIRVYDESGNYFQSQNLPITTPQSVPVGHLVPYAGFPDMYVFLNDGYPAVVAWLGVPQGLAVDQSTQGAGLLYAASVEGVENHSSIRSINPVNNVIGTTAGFIGAGYAGDGGAAWRATLNMPHGVAVDPQGNILIADTANNRIRRVDATTGLIATIAGTGAAAHSGDGGPAVEAAMNAPQGITTDAAGNIYIAERGSHSIRKITAVGVISTLSGDGTAGYNGDNIAANQARLNGPVDVKLDGCGNIYIAEQDGNRIRRIAAGTGLITTMAGGAQQLNGPAGLAVSPSGDIYFSGVTGHRVYKLGADGQVSPVAGTGTAGTDRTGPEGLNAQLSAPTGLAGDWARGVLYIGDANRISALGIAPGININPAPPVTAAHLEGPHEQAFGLTVISTATKVILTVAYAEGGGCGCGTGVKETIYEITNLNTSSTTAPVVYTSSFTLGEGSFLIRFRSTDSAGNVEAFKELRVSATPWLGSALVAAGNITITGNAAVTGQKIANNAEPAPLYLPGLLQSAAAANNNAAIVQYLNNGVLTLGGNTTITLSSGVYYLKGLSLGGNSKVLLSGNAELIVDGNISISGGAALNKDGPAENLAMFISSAAAVNISGNSALTANLYAPSAALALTGNTVFTGHGLVHSAALSGNAKMKMPVEAISGGKIRVAAGGFAPMQDAAAFALGEVYVYPNPAKGAQVPTFHIETGIADSVNIKIYTVSGAIAHQQTITAQPSLIDDGNGQSYAYEYAWRGHIASGVYFYVMEAEKAGKKLKKTGRFAVVR